MPTFRYRFDPGQLAATVETLGLSVSGPLLGSFDATPSTVPQEALDDAGQIVDAVAEAIGVANHPTRVVEVLAMTPATGEMAVGRLASDDSGSWVAVAGEHDIDLASVDTDAEAALLIDDLAMLTSFSSEAGNHTGTLSLPAVMALMAAADAVRELRLRYDFNRAGPAPTAVFDSAELRRLLDLGLDRTDTRWAVTAFAPLKPAEFTVDAAVETLGELEAAGFVAPVDGGFSLTEAGSEVAAALDGAVRLSRIRMAVPDDGALVTVAEIFTVRSVLRLVVGVWANLSTRPEASVMSLGGADAVRLLTGMLGAGR